MKTSFYRFAALLLFAAALSAGCGERTDDMRLLYWNIQNGMWSDQSNGYDNFVAWVKGYDPDVCVWCEAQSIYKSGTAERMDSVDRYLTANWGELAARYGHKYWYVGGHRDNFPQVVTSKYPIENVQRIVGQAPDSIVSHGAGWARIVKNGRPVNIVTLHTWPQAYAFQAVDRDASKAEHGGDRYRRMEKHPAEFHTTTHGQSRIDFVYCTQPLCERITRAEVIVDDFTEPVRDPGKLSNFYHPSDHRPILVDFDMK